MGRRPGAHTTGRRVGEQLDPPASHLVHSSAVALFSGQEALISALGDTSPVSGERVLQIEVQTDRVLGAEESVWE